MRRTAAFLIVLLLAACGEPEGDYVAVTGGGFIFNYRIAEAYYGLVAEPKRAVPAGTEFVAEFENPAGGEPLVVRRIPREGSRRISLNTPPLEGVVKDRDYRVVLSLMDPQTGAVIETHEKSFRSSLDQSVLPDAPLTVGPGYHRPPARPEGP